MIKRLSYCLLICCLVLSSCGKEVPETVWDGPVIELGVACMEPTDPTKAGSDGVQAGDNSYHENVISWVDFYFYPGGATFENASYHVRKESGKRENDVFRIELTTNQVNYQIFPVQSETTEASVFAIANGPKDLLDGLEDTSLDNIKRQVVSTEFVNVSYTNHRQDQFMMSGSATITLSGRSQKVVSQGLVGLLRYASKITVGIKMEEQVEMDSGRFDGEGNPIMEVWTPRPQEMRIYLVDGVRKVQLGGAPAGSEGTDAPTDADYLTYGDYPLYFYNSAGELYFDKEGEYFQTFPMYTYPYHWTTGSAEEGSREPYLKLVLPWDRKAGNGISAVQKEFYYKILIPQDRRGGEFANSFVRNNWYHYDVGVGVLGADTDEAAVALNAELFIVYWQDKNVVVKHANIGNARYLSVEKEEYYLYNQQGIDVRYTTSNPIAIKNVHVTRPYYGESPSVGYNSKYKGDVKRVSYSDDDTYDDIYPEGSYYLEFSEEQRIALNAGTADEGKDWLQDLGGVIRYSHTLNNDYTTDLFDYSTYTIVFDVGHADSREAWMEKYDKHVKIVQNPGLYLHATPNPDTWTGVTGDTTPDHWGYVFVNDDQYTRTRYDADLKLVPADEKEAWRLDHIWRVVHYSSGGTDMYRIDVSVLPEDSEFVLGDPRQSTVDNLRTGMDEYFATAPAIEGGERSLQWYYPTEASDRTVNMLAPAYRISTKLSGSEYGGTPLEQARMRCASFQENGFPAGRWRLPTEGEVRFISNLSAHEVFEWQFSGNYWSANGAVNVNKANKTVTRVPYVTVAMLRCVYDSWYWGDERVLDGNGVPSQFTWGDAQR
ncbi:MAG: hypothetical protein IJU68_02710 [Bacteroidales bacterium]|nr:hypothetical protein [Bacteroidales bacterium]